MTAGAEERAHSGVLLQALYPLGSKVPGLNHLPEGVRRMARRAATRAAVDLHLRRCRNTRIVGVTGSMGKTTVKDLLGEMLAPDGPTIKTRHNDNGLYGVPASLLLIRPEDRYAVIEVGIHDQPGEMRWMARMFTPEVAVLTSVGVDHVPAYGSRSAIAKEKRALLERLPPRGVAVVSADDELARGAAEGLGCRVISAGWAVDADVHIDGARLAWPDGMDVELNAFGERIEGRLALFGRHLAPAAALAVAAAAAAGVPGRTALERAAATFSPSPGRMRPVPGPRDTTFIHDDFKSRVHSAVAAIRTLGEIEGARRLAVLGEVQDADHTDATYAPVAEVLPGRAERVVAVGRSGPPLARLLEGTGLAGNVTEVGGAREAAATLASELEEGDVVLVHASTRQHLERIHLLLDREPVRCLVHRCVLDWRCQDCPYLPTGPPDSVVAAA